MESIERDFRGKRPKAVSSIEWLGAPLATQAIWEGSGEEPVLLHIEQLRWLRHLFWIPAGHPIREVFWACSTGRSEDQRHA